MNDLFLLEEFIKEALLDEARKKKRKSERLKRKSLEKRKALNTRVNIKPKVKEKRN